eukprot:scaffold274169_cov31-Tisochrysis_lutea.AAC.1
MSATRASVAGSASTSASACLCAELACMSTHLDRLFCRLLPSSPRLPTSSSTQRTKSSLVNPGPATTSTLIFSKSTLFKMADKTCWRHFCVAFSAAYSVKGKKSVMAVPTTNLLDIEEAADVPRYAVSGSEIRCAARGAERR